MKNGFGRVFLRTRIGGAWWLPVLFLLAIAVTVTAETSGDYVYTINPNGTVRIDEYTGPGGAVTIPSNIVSRTVVGIGRIAFAGSSNLTSVTIPNSVTYIEDLVFNACTSLASVTIGSGLADIGYRAFNNCTNLTAITVDTLNASYSSVAGVLFNKSRATLIQYPVGKAGAYTIPNGVTRIGDYAFDSCTRLTGITLPNGVTSIGKEAFWGCTSLAGVTLPDSVTSIGMDAFNWCTSLASVTLGNGVTSIGDSAFYECTSLTGVTLPGSVTNIGEFAFSRCTSLTAFTVDALNSSYSSLDGVLFNKSQTVLVQCPGGKAGSYTIPNSVTNIGGDAFAPYYANGLGGFSWCTRLTGVTLPNSVTSIGKNAFLYCTGLTGITIPNSVTALGTYAFEDCTGLTGVTLGNGITSIVYWAFSGCTSLTGVTIPNSVTSIGAQAFQECTSLANVTIPNSVTSIGMDAFASCTGLTSVTLGNGVTSLEDAAFWGCTNLTGVYFWGNAPSLGLNVFTNDDIAIVYYLAGTTGWGTTFGGRPTVLWNPLPRPIITANGVTGTVTVNYPEAVSVAVEMNAGNYAGTEVDWWILAFAYTGEWYYMNSVYQWTPFNGNLAACHPMYQGPLGNVPATPVLSGILPRGTYGFWFAVDYPMNGIMNGNAMLYSSVTVSVQ